MLLHRQFVTVAKAKGRKLAFIDHSAGRRIDYSRALLGSILIARRFRQYRDGYLGIMIPNSAGCALSVLASLFIGKIPVMINYSTGAQQNARYAQIKCGFKTVITSRALLDKIGCEPIDGMVFIEDLMRQITPLEKLTALAKLRLPIGALLRTVHDGRGDDTAVILFTSGSEREPKAVELTHRNISSNLIGARAVFDFDDSDIFLSILPLFHVFGLTTSLWLPLCLGLPMVMHGNPLEFKTISRIIREDKPTIMLATPYFLMGYLKQSKPGDFASLRIVVAGADKLPEWLRKAYYEQHAVSVYEGYGATETSPVISVNLPGAHKPGSVGRPLPGVQVKVTDIETGEELGPNQEGKLLVKGAVVMNGWYETGDMGIRDDDGYLWHRGRLKRFVKVGGEMVSLVMIEDELQQLLPTEIECCVVDIPDAKKGASIAVALNAQIDRKRILGQLSERLPSLALPRHFVAFDELPKMGSGKIDFRRTAELVKAQLNARRHGTPSSKVTARPHLPTQE